MIKASYAFLLAITIMVWLCEVHRIIAHSFYSNPLWSFSFLMVEFDSGSSDKTIGENDVHILQLLPKSEFISCYKKFVANDLQTLGSFDFPLVGHKPCTLVRIASA
jgi:hypothetical protein